MPETLSIAAHAALPEPPRLAKRQPVSHQTAVWFRVNLGREKKADPRWILPLVCRLGGVTRNEIGKIVIQDRESRFQVAGPEADRFEKAAAKQEHDPRVRITRVREGDPPSAAGSHGHAPPRRAKPPRR
jgi:ATP-dependent RNA helicase DeaD